MISLVFPVTDITRVSEVRSAALQLAKEEGLNESLSGSASLVATECATNLVKHARGGEIYLSPLSGRGSPGVEVLAVDSGPGMEDYHRCMEDGFSTVGTPGTGLGAIRRHSQVFEVYSTPGQGTVVLSQITVAKSGAALNDDLLVGALKRRLDGQSYCGDDWAVCPDTQAIVMMVADGLGHGLDASQAATAAVGVFQRAGTSEPGELLTRIHLGLKSTRGAAVAVARADYAQGKIVYAGLGNISAAVAFPGKTSSMVSMYGTCGHSARKIQEFNYDWPANSVVVMHSDGLSAQWNLDADPGLIRCHPGIIAAVLYRRACRTRDDACIVVLKKNGPH